MKPAPHHHARSLSRVHCKTRQRTRVFVQRYPTPKLGPHIRQEARRQTGRFGRTQGGGAGKITVCAGTEGEHEDAGGGVEAVARGDECSARLQGVEKALGLRVAPCPGASCQCLISTLHTCAYCQHMKASSSNLRFLCASLCRRNNRACASSHSTCAAH